MSYAQLMSRQYGSELSETPRAYLEFILAGAERMRDLIEGFLASVGGGEVKAELISLERCLSDARTGLQAQIEEGGATITVSQLPVVFGKRLELTEVFQNLLANAIAYRKPGVSPNLRVRAERDNHFWKVLVEDNGIGFSMDQAQEIWKLHATLPLNGQTTVPGKRSGIGLALVKRIVEDHGGTVEARSTPGVGSIFCFTVPQIIYSTETRLAETNGTPVRKNNF